MKKVLYLCILLFSVAACSKDDASIIGTASADAGKVVQGITVKLYDDNASLINQTNTDNQGTFAFHGLASGNYYVAATIAIDGVVWDTGNTPRIFYVGGEIEKEIALTLTRKP